MLTYPDPGILIPLRADTPSGQTPPQGIHLLDITDRADTSPNADTPLVDTPLGRHPPSRHPSFGKHPLGRHPPASRWLLLWTVHILLEYFLVELNISLLCSVYENYKSEESKCVECVGKQKASFLSYITSQGLQLLSSPMVKICLKSFLDRDKNCLLSLKHRNAKSSSTTNFV